MSNAKVENFSVNSLDFKRSVRAATTEEIVLFGAQTVDGVGLAVGDRVLVKNQTDQSQNGIYEASSGAWDRSSDADHPSEATPNFMVFVEEGSANVDTGWMLGTKSPITLGTTPLSFFKFAEPVGFKMEEAPTDGSTYGRRDGQWSDIAQASSLQLRRGTDAERRQITPLEGEPIYTTDTKKLYVGDGVTAGGNEIVSGASSSLAFSNPPEMARLVTTSGSGSFTATLRSTTGNIAVRWWDGSVETFGTGFTGVDIAASKAIPTSGAWSKSAPKEIFMWSCLSDDATQTGTITQLICSNNGLVSVEVAGLSSLELLNCGSNQLRSLSLSGLSSLTQLFCQDNEISSLDVSGLPQLVSLYCGENQIEFINLNGLFNLESLFCGNNSLSSIDLRGLSALSFLVCDDNSLSSLDLRGLSSLSTAICKNNSLSSLNVEGLTSLTNLDCSGNGLSSLNISGLSSLTLLDCKDNSLETLRAEGVELQYGYYGDGSKMSNNNLSAAALDQFFTDLEPTETGILFVDGNPGSATCNPSIATSKGYVVVTV